MKGKLHHNVVLKGPSADIDTWDVQLKTNDDTTRFVGEGWQDFVTAFSLEENDSLVFKYKNNSYFKVRIFDGKTSCEKESSHFVIKSVSNRTKRVAHQFRIPKALSRKLKVKEKRSDIMIIIAQ